MAFFHTRTGHVLRYGVSCTLLVAFALQVEWGRFAALRGGFEPGPVVVAVVLAGASFPLMAWRWWLLLRAQGVRVDFRWAHVVTWISTFYNSFLIGGLGGDAARVYHVCRDAGERRAGGLATVFLDRVMGLAVLMSIAAAALVTRTGALAAEPRLRWLFVAAVGLTLAAAAVVLAMLVVAPARWPAWLRRLLRPKGAAALAGLVEAIRCHRRAHTWALAASYGVWLLDIVAIWLLARAVGLPLPFVETCIAVSVAYAAAVLPISVGGHGVREGTLLGVLVLFGLLRGDTDAAAPMQLALLTWAVTVFWSLVGGLVLLLARTGGNPQVAGRDVTPRVH